MGLEETILMLLIAKNAINFLPFCFLKHMHNQTMITSTLILMFTDTVIAGYLLFVWFTGWPLSNGFELVSLRFLCFLNETYWCVSLLLPWASINEELVHMYLHRWGNLAGSAQTLFLQACLISLTSWLVAASYGFNCFRGLSFKVAECDLQIWRCLFTYLHEAPNFNLLIPFTGVVLGGTLSYTIFVYNHYAPFKVEIGEKHYKLSMKALLFSIVVVGSFWVLPPVLAVSSLSTLSLDTLIGIFRIHNLEQLSTVHTETINESKDLENYQIQTHAVQITKNNKWEEPWTLQII
ncbi:uncharacterized protein LOC134611250 [Pelobates fuscus]|uniref:uncharacterized protein LOC134611250 n=1 Tax=Pelobates fuscus TaxID=191477 RepID=UPI002FE47761